MVCLKQIWYSLCMDIKQNLSTYSTPWYRKTWAIPLFFGIVIFILIGTIFLIQIFSYSDQINLNNIKTDGITQKSIISDVPLSIIPRNQIETSDDPSFGNPDATVVIVEFGDFECPFCGQAFPVIREMQTEFKDQILFIWRDLPLNDIHPNAQKAAEASECAQDQNKFWEFHDKLFLNQAQLTPENLKSYARQVGMNGTLFDECFDSGKYASEVQEDSQLALSAGAEGTPTFFINGQRISGVIPRDTFRQIITQLLSEN